MRSKKDVSDLHEYVFPALVFTCVALPFRWITLAVFPEQNVLTDVGAILGASATGVMATVLLVRGWWQWWLVVWLGLLANDMLLGFVRGFEELPYGSLAPLVPAFLWGVTKCTRRRFSEAE